MPDGLFFSQLCATAENIHRPLLFFYLLLNHWNKAALRISTIPRGGEHPKGLLDIFLVHRREVLPSGGFGDKWLPILLLELEPSDPQ